MNTVSISGNLTRDPELREIRDDLVVCDFAVAVNQSKKVGDEWVDVAHFVDCSIFGGRGEMLARKAAKGDLVFVHGRLNYSSWETDEGQKRSKLTVVADDVEGEWRFRKSDGASRSEKSSSATSSKATGKSKASADDDIPF